MLVLGRQAGQRVLHLRPPRPVQKRSRLWSKRHGGAVVVVVAVVAADVVSGVVRAWALWRPTGARWRALVRPLPVERRALVRPLPVERRALVRPLPVERRALVGRLPVMRCVERTLEIKTKVLGVPIRRHRSILAPHLIRVCEQEEGKYQPCIGEHAQKQVGTHWYTILLHAPAWGWETPTARKACPSRTGRRLQH